jgi:hypothetical protein
MVHNKVQKHDVTNLSPCSRITYPLNLTCEYITLKYIIIKFMRYLNFMIQIIKEY